MFWITRILLILVIFRTIDSSKNVCDKDCIGNVMLTRRNYSKASDHNITIVHSMFKQNMKWNQVIRVNDTEDSEDSLHHIIPEVSNYERDFINLLSHKYLKLQQPFDLSHAPSVSLECQRDSRKFVESLKRFEMWALKMHDASGKLSSGILNGNVNQFGDFDQCLNVDSPSDNLQGKYCLSYLQPNVPKSLRYTNHLRKLLQSHEAFKSKFDDPGHRVPRYSTINWAFCVPSSCSHKDVETSVRHYIKTFTNGTGINFDVRVEDEMCQVKVNWMERLDRPTMIAIVTCVGFLLIILFSTVYECLNEKVLENNLISSFSLIRNTKSLFSMNRDTNDIKSAHAIRFLNAVMLVLSHKCMALFFNPYTNRTAMTEQLGKPWTVLARAASLYTDPFLMLSGMLTAYSLFGKLQRNGHFSMWREYVGRYLRIMPPLAFLILFCTFILPHLGDGPQWNLVVTHHSAICKQHWWRNLLFIHNWFGFSNMCLTHTHHVGIDTELFAVAPFLILTFWRWPRKGLHMIIGLAVVSTVARYYVTYTHGLSNYVFFGTSVKQLFETADRMYINPPHRFTVYAMGIGLGYVLRMFKDMKLSEKQLKIGWCLSIASFILAFFGPAPMGDIDYKYNATQAACYAAFAPIAWCFFFGWIILVSQLGYKNKLIELLEWRGFLVCTKLSYGLYLTQFPVFFYNVGRVRTPLHYGFLKIILDTNEFISIVIVSVLLTLFVEMPCNNLKNLLLDNKNTNIQVNDIKLTEVNEEFKEKNI